MSLRMPAEHGAWGILLVPFVCAATVAASLTERAGWPLFLAGVCALGLFLLRGSLDHCGDWRAIHRAEHLALAGAAILAGGALVFFYARLALIPLAALGLGLYILQASLGRNHSRDVEKRSLAAELVGVGILTLTAPAAWIAARGALDRIGLQVWLLNLLFFAGGVLYVKYRVRGVLAHRSFPRLTERLAFAWPVFVYHLLLVVFLLSWMWLDSVPVAVMAAFAPGVLRAYGLLLQLGQRFPIKRLGWSEVAHSLLFAGLLILAFRWNI